MTPKTRIFYPLVAIWLIADILTKRWVVPFLGQHGGSYPVVGDHVRFTLGLNPGMAFGLKFGSQSRWILITFTILTLGLILHLYRQTPVNQKLQTFALALITGGALGNLLDRLRSPHGVVDFIDVGIGSHRFWLFNVADSGISIGGILLVLTLWVTPDREKETGKTSAAASL